MKKLLLDAFFKSRQRGVALLFALAILALLLVMALSFATSSIFDQITASNAANAGSARLIANSALNRVLTILSAYGDSPVSNIQYSYNTAPPNHQDMIKKLFAGSGTNFTNQQVAWEYITQQDSISNRIVGRFAYIVTPISGIDPGAIVKKGVDEALNLEPRPGVDVDEINVISVSPADITPLAGKFNYTAAAALPAIQPDPGFFDGAWVDYANMFGLMTITDTVLQEKFKKWFIIDSPINDEKYWVDVNANKTPDTGEFFNRFNLARTDWDTAFNTKEKMYEKILLDSNHDGIPDFDPAAPPAGMSFVTPGISDGYGIPWLAYFGYKADGTLDQTLGATFGNTAAGVIARRRQIAANLVDYCTSGYAATSDSNDWITIAPTFTGNKRTPYIDEIGVALEASATYTKKTVLTADDTYNVTVSLNGYLLGKLIDIYNIPPAIFGQPFTLKIRGAISYKVTVDGNNLATVVNQPFEFDLPSTLPFTWNAGYGTYVYTFNAATLPASLTSPDITIATTPNPVTVVNGVSVSITSAILYDTTGGFKGYDYSTINKNSGLPVDLLNCDPTTVPAVPQSTFFSFQTEDPRQNLNAGDWYVTTAVPQVYNAAVSSGIGSAYWKVKWENPMGTGYTGIVNEKGNPAGGYSIALAAANGNPDLCEADKEVCADPAGYTLSTAFIRNAAMLSPWEIGFIHRGVKWQTLNLKQYDKNKAISLVAVNIPDVSYPYTRIPGGGNYADLNNGGGDANILDQVKMTDATQKYKININAKYVDLTSHKNVVLQALLANIVIGSDPTTPGATGAGSKIAIGTALDNLCTAIMSQNYTTRAEVANAKINALNNGTCGKTQDTDARQEELIGKFINLTDVSGSGVKDYFTVIILAQTIKDVGAPSGPGPGIPITKKDKNGNAVAFSAKLGTFDMQESPFGSGNYVYADEIVAEQKIRVIVHREAVGTYRILSFEYME